MALRYYESYLLDQNKLAISKKMNGSIYKHVQIFYLEFIYFQAQNFSNKKRVKLYFHCSVQPIQILKKF